MIHAALWVASALFLAFVGFWVLAVLFGILSAIFSPSPHEIKIKKPWSPEAKMLIILFAIAVFACIVAFSVGK